MILQGKIISKYNRRISLLIWLLYAAIALSGWSYYILCDLLKLPFYFFEIFFIPIIIKYYTVILEKIKNIKIIDILVFTFLVGSLLIGLLINPEHIMAQITTYRTLFYAWGFMYMFSRMKGFDIDLLQAVCVGSCIGEMFFVLLVNRTSEDVSAINIMALAIMVIIPIIKNNILQTLIFTVFGLVLAFISAFRITIVVVLLAFIVSLLYMAVCKKRYKAMALMLLSFLGGILILTNMEQIVKFLVETLKIENAFSIYRVTYRLQQLFKLDFVASQDTVRFELLIKIFTEFYNCIIPKGLIGKDIGLYGLYKDAPIMFFYHAFGSVISLILIGFIIIQGIRITTKVLYIKNTEIAVVAIMFPILVLLFFLNGTFIMATYESCLLGIVLGYWYNRHVW